jgi:hypothetical protein
MNASGVARRRKISEIRGLAGPLCYNSTEKSARPFYFLSDGFLRVVTVKNIGKAT